MKRFCVLLTALALSLSLSGCYDRGEPAPSSETGEASSSSAEESVSVPEAPTVTEKPEAADSASETADDTLDKPDDPDRAEKLEMIAEIERETGLALQYSEEDGRIFLHAAEWEDCDDYDFFRACFFGRWEGRNGYEDIFLIDDSESGHIGFDGFQKLGADVYGFCTTFFYDESRIYWLRASDPTRLYMTHGIRSSDGQCSAWIATGDGTIYTYEKTAPPNEPEEGFLSNLRLLEIARDYGIDPSLLTELKFGEYFRGEGNYVPIYLISEAPEKLELKTKLRTAGSWSFTDVNYTLERIDGEWVRTVEYGEGEEP